MPGNLEGSLLLKTESLQGNINPPMGLVPFVFSLALSRSLALRTFYTWRTQEHGNKKNKIKFKLIFKSLNGKEKTVIWILIPQGAVLL